VAGGTGVTDPPVEAFPAQREAELLERARQAFAMQQQGNLGEAAKIYQEILMVDEDQFYANHFLGVIAARTGQFDAALALISHATELDPSDVDAWSNLGNVLRQLGRLDEALASYDRAIALNAGHALSYSNRANVLTKLERFEEALQGYEQAIAIAPDFVDAWSNRGILLHELGRLDDAIVSFDKAIQLDPDYAEAWSHRGGPLRELARFDEAIAGFDRAIALRPDFADAWYNRAVMLQEIGRVDEAIDNFDRALALDPDYVTAKLSRAYAHLFTGDFEQGWTGYELRWHVPDAYLPALPFDEASWHGEQDLAGRSILIHDEQGLGDTIQFCRYIGQLNALGARVLFAPRPSLVGLMRTLDFPCEIVAIEDGAHDVDYHCPIASLPLAFRTTLATIPSRPSYLHADPARAARWAERIGSHGFKIGICWQGRPGKVDIGRSFPLAALAPIARLPEVRLISLHRGSGEAQLASLPDGMTVEALGEDFDAGPDSFLDTAAAIAQCDLVITSDTSIAHLAGALGAPTWIALKRGCDWRWLADRSDSPWYPSVRLFRQSVAGDWAHVFNDIERALTSVLETRTDRIDRSL
jgi:tetratricopeptide (TPR) repeat protein